MLGLLKRDWGWQVKEEREEGEHRGSRRKDGERREDGERNRDREHDDKDRHRDRDDRCLTGWVLRALQANHPLNLSILPLSSMPSCFVSICCFTSCWTGVVTPDTAKQEALNIYADVAQ